MLRHSIYSVRDKKKVDAEVIDIREIESAKGVRFQIVGIHPVDGTTVTTFCSASVAEDYREQLGKIQHGLSAENIVVAQDHIPESEATVVSIDGTPVEDDLETFVEDPLVGSPSEGTLTSAKVLAAEGESEKKNCGCGQDPCKTYGAEEVSEDTGSKFKETDTGSIGVTVNGDWAGPGDEGEKMAIDIKLDPYQYHMMRDTDGLKTNTAQGWFEEIVNEGRKPKEVIDEYIAEWAGDDWRKELDEGNSGFAAETVAGVEVQTPSQIAIETPDSDELIVPDPDHLVNGDGHVIGQQTGKVNTTPMHAEHGDDEDDDEDDDDYEYYEAPTFAGNKRVLVPTAVIGGLALAYLAKPELLSGSFDKISEMLGKLTKKDDKTE